MTACSNCGFDLGAEMRFCPRCGTPVANGASTPRWRRTGIALVPPESDDDLCEIECWQGYVKADFGARVVGTGAEVARSRLFWWRHRRLPAAEGKALAAHQELVIHLRELGWEPVGRPHPWYAQRFRRSSEPASEPLGEEEEPAGPTGQMDARTSSKS